MQSLARTIGATFVGAILVMIASQFISHATDEDLREVERRTNAKIELNTRRFESHTSTANLEWRKQAAFRGAVIDRLDLNVSATETRVEDLPVASIRSDSDEVIPQ